LFIIVAITNAFNSIAYAAEWHYTPQIAEIENGKGRKAYAKKLYTFFSKIDEFLPSLSPSQRDWLEKEWKTYHKNQNSQRYIAIVKSKEYKIDYVKFTHKKILIELAFIKNASEQKKELYLWTAITVYLLDTEYWQNLHFLIQKDLVDKKFFGSEDWYRFYLDNEDYFFINMGEIPARRILINIVKPYFAGDLPN